MTLSDMNTYLRLLDAYLERADGYLSPDDKESIQWLLEQVHTFAPDQYPVYRDRFLGVVPSSEGRIRDFEQNVGKTVLQRRVDFFAPGRDAYAAARVIRSLNAFFEQDDFNPASGVRFDVLADKIQAIVTRRDFSYLSNIVGLMMYLADHALIDDCIVLVDGARGLIQLARNDFSVVDPPIIDLLKDDSEKEEGTSVWARVFHDDLIPVIGYGLDHQAIYRVLSDLDPALAEFYFQTIVETARPPATLGEWILSQKDYFVILVDAAANLARASGQNQGTFVPLEQVWEQFLFLLIARAAQKLPPMLWQKDREILLEKAVAFQEALRGIWQSPSPISFLPETPVPALTHAMPARESGQGGGINLAGADGSVASGDISALAMPSFDLTRESELSDRPLFQIVGAEEPAMVSPIGFHIVGAELEEQSPQVIAVDGQPALSGEAGTKGMNIFGIAAPKPLLGSASAVSFVMRVVR